MDINYLADSVNDNKEFRNLLKQATTRLFAALPDMIFSTKLRQIKICHMNSQHMLYIFEYYKDTFNVYMKNVFTYGPKQSSLQILYPYIKALKLDSNAPLYLYKLLSFSAPGFLQHTQKPSIFSVLQNMFNSTNDGIVVRSDKALDISFLRRHRDHIELTSNLSDLVEYTKLLTSHNVLPEYSISFYKSLMQKINPVIKASLSKFEKQLHLIRDICDYQKFASYTHSYNYNSMAARVWSKDNKLVLIDANSGFYIKYIDASNYTVYYIDCDKHDIHTEIKRFNNSGVADIDFLKDVALNVVNGIVDYACQYKIQIFELILQDSSENMKIENLHIGFKSSQRHISEHKKDVAFSY